MQCHLKAVAAGLGLQLAVKTPVQVQVHGRQVEHPELVRQGHILLHVDLVECRAGVCAGIVEQEAFPVPAGGTARGHKQHHHRAPCLPKTVMEVELVKRGHFSHSARDYNPVAHTGTAAAGEQIQRGKVLVFVASTDRLQYLPFGHNTLPGEYMMPAKKLLIVVCLSALVSGHALAETRYVSDHLEITMRSGKSTSHGITRMLQSGTPLTVLETDNDSGYSRVRTKDGKQGWVLSRFLMEGQAARDILATTEKKLAELELENRKLETDMNKMKEDMGSIEKERIDLDGINRNVSQELAAIKRTASSALAIDSENKELKSRVVALERNLQTLHQENEGLKDRTARDWFMVGAAVVLLGIIVGLIIPRIRWRKKSSWDTF